MTAYVERRRYCRSCGQRHELPRYQAEPESNDVVTLWTFGIALLVGLVMFAALFAGLAVWQ